MNPKQKRTPTIVLHSGGVDSTVVLAQSLRSAESISLGVAYGQRHIREIRAAREIAAHLGVERVELDLSEGVASVFSGCLTDPLLPIPEGHYSDLLMRQTVVPNRNMVLLSLGIALAVTRGADRVLYGAHAGDAAIYPDCRPDFVRRLSALAMVANYSPVMVGAPLLAMTKTNIVRLGLNLEAPLHLTWTCYVGGEEPCGKCGSCAERAEAFRSLGRTDPWPGK